MEIVRLMKDRVNRATRRYLHGAPSHDTSSRFFRRLVSVVEQVFSTLMRWVKRLIITRHAW